MSAATWVSPIAGSRGRKIFSALHTKRPRRAAARVGEPQHVQAAQRRVPEPPLHHDAQVVLLAAEVLVESVLDDVALGRRQTLLELLRLHLVRERRQVDPVDAEARRAE